MGAIGSAWAATPDAVDAAWVLRQLARPAPMHTAFVELRDSPLLKAPLRISGEYRRPDEATLVREVQSPYAETTTIKSSGAGAGQATIVRGTRSRSFSLARVPELAGLQASFGALLAGDRATLEQHYRVAAAGTRQHWMLTLVPRDAALAAKVRDIALHGRGAELRCIETRPVRGGGVQRTLLASAARAAINGIADPKALAAICTAD
ncbi:MAG TPA: LolA-related protein [Lysobacter sp.]|nr:LolA-related protein [Lysobacter sp.]